jgi:fatty-acyl-CoA synthase
MDYVRFHGCLHPDKPAVVDLAFERRWSYEQFDRFVAGCTAILIDEGVVEGDRVACLSKNRAEVIALHLACARLGAVFVPLNWRLSSSELAAIVADCEPVIVYGDDMALALGVDAADIGLLHDRCRDVQLVWPEQKSEDIPSLMLYTSGTTGSPKGVMLSERNLSETAINFSLLGEVDSDSHFLVESPMFHIIGMVTCVRPPFLLGARVSISERFIPERTYSRLADPALKISHYFCVPPMALAIRAVDGFDASRFAGLKAIFTGGAPHPEAQIRDWLKDGVAIVDGFGMSETGTVFGMPLDRRLIDQKAGCVGVPTPRMQARIVDDDDEPVPLGTPGELQLKGDNIARGYWRKDTEYQNCLTEDGWFRTGDILTQDGDGYYRVVDRKKDMFISGGENVYPVEIEAQLTKYPGIRELAVVGVPDAKWGEVGCLFYVPESAELNLEDVRSFLTTRLARYKIPKHACAVNELPRNGVGKLMRYELRRIYRETRR